MTFFRSRRCARYMAMFLVAALYLIPGATSVLAAAAAPAAPRATLLVFPFDQSTAQGAPENLGANFANALKVSLSGDKSFMVMEYSERLPSVQRALNDSLKKEDVAGPFGTEKDQVDKAVKIASAIAADLVLVGTIDEYKYDDAKKQASVNVTAQLVDVRSGKSMKIVSATGRSPEGSKVTDEKGLAALAAGDAVSKIAADITPQAAPYNAAQPQTQQVQYQQPKQKSSKWKKWILPVLLAVGIGIAVASSGDNGGNGGDIPPPPQ